MRITRVLSIAALTFIPAAASAQAATKVDVSGTWSFTVTTGNGSGTPTVTFKQAGDSISGHYSSQLLGERDFKGTLKDGKIAFSFTVDVEGTSFNAEYKGTVESNFSMKGTVTFGQLGEGSFTGARQKQ